MEIDVVLTRVRLRVRSVILGCVGAEAFCSGGLWYEELAMAQTLDARVLQGIAKQEDRSVLLLG